MLIAKSEKFSGKGWVGAANEQHAVLVVVDRPSGSERLAIKMTYLVLKSDLPCRGASRWIIDKYNYKLPLHFGAVVGLLAKASQLILVAPGTSC